MDDDKGAGGGPNLVDHAVGALNAWFGDYLAKTDNGLHQPMAFYQGNRPVEPEALEAPAGGKLCVLVHGLGCTEGLWPFPAPHAPQDYGRLFERDGGYLPLYVRFNSGLRISDNGRQLNDLIHRYCSHHSDKVQELLLIGHSMGGLIIRSACHLAQQAGQGWVQGVGHVIYLGSPHLGAPLEKATNVASHVLGMFDTTATRVIRDLLNTRSEGVKDLRFGNLLDEDWLACDPDELMNNRRVPVPWLDSARHLRVVGEAAQPARVVGDTVVRPDSAAGRAMGSQPGAPVAADVRRMAGFDHLTLARHPDVYEVMQAWVNDNG